MATVENDVPRDLAATVADLRRELDTLKAESAVVKTVVGRLVRECERVRAALVVHEEASIAAVDGVHLVARLIAAVRAKVDSLTNVGRRCIDPSDNVLSINGEDLCFKRSRAIDHTSLGIVGPKKIVQGHKVSS